ncbi:hypothetical protein N0V93_007015 [Gnomoniopsis smithogilvyi]|uniref:peptidyl-tRNA hydrolase n=1 Tax=Gnomoniopsis smithogilvyi TaxID=1191159 RepID=A0A9W8YPP6_9PEZI|nr:hypothetical protein N0V93_007015 [Gnomoniopsis smithogilvyi]
MNSTAHSNSTDSPVEDAVFEPHFLVVSLGNPAPYGDGLHSAGHFALQALQKELVRDHQQPPFSSERIGKKACRASRGPKYTLLQCPTLMNISGPWLAKAWKEVLAESSETHTPLGLVLMHDDLEEDLGIVKTRAWETSHRGHNGLKSVMASMKPTDYRDSRWAKIRVGIGRPEARDHNTVADFVLRPMSKHQKAILSEKSGSPVLSALKKIEAEWTSEINPGATQQGPKSTKQLHKGKKGTRPDTTSNV